MTAGTQTDYLTYPTIHYIRLLYSILCFINSGLRKFTGMTLLPGFMLPAECREGF